MSNRILGRRWLRLLGGVGGTGLIACSQVTSPPPTSSVTSVPIPPDEAAVAEPVSDETALEEQSLTRPLCSELIDHYDDGNIEQAMALEQSVVDGDAAIANRAALGAKCSEILREDISMALVDVSLILDELESSETVSDRTLNQLTGGECWLISGAYSGTDALVKAVVEDDLAGENVVGRHCAALFADAAELYAPLLTAMENNADLSYQDCWLLRGAYDAEVERVKDAIGDTPNNKPELSDCAVEFGT